MKAPVWRKHLAALLLTLPTAALASEPDEVRLDYAYYAPTSLILKDQGILERRLADRNISVRWVQSLGSNRALEYLNSNSIDFGSTAGLASVLSRANGSPVKVIYVASRPEWTALVVPQGSPIQNVADLRGKKIAATKGTDPYLFLLRTLNEAGLDKDDVEIIHLQHPDGRVALEQGRVDAWAGLDPHMAASEIQAGSRLLSRNLDFNSYGVLNVSDTFAREQPELIKEVIAAYEEARQWALAHPEDTAALLAKEAGLPLEVARLQLSRTDFSNPLPGAEHVAALKAAASILVEEELVRRGTDVAAAVDQLISPQLAAEVIGTGHLAKASGE
ncbi:MAG: aliphatic sulfonates ABC transporter substrate-binding protein [Gammaproteobacteria bacterium HGW-Gammaproteobacteria-11]|nr:MAG: aliphatic sulfonates ABC transporter substrate-binding protein [Gammaproteobacteria bacterium HGW-Gammaproteobacteria-11]